MGHCRKIASKTILYIVLIWGIVFLLQGTAVAHLTHPQEEAVSPFEQTGNHAYCSLTGRHTGTLVCPHAKRPLASEPVKIASECGGSPTGQLPAKFGFSHNPNLTDSSYFLDPDIMTFPFIISILLIPSLLPDSLYHPPKSL